MDAFHRTKQDSREQDIKQRKEALKAREIKVRLQEIEHELEAIPSKASTAKQRSQKRIGTAGSTKVQSFPFELNKTAKFWLIVVAVIVGIRLLNALSAVVIIAGMTWIPPLVILGIAWIVYKLFIEEDDA